MTKEESHGIVDVEKIEPVAVHIEEKEAGAGTPDTRKKYTVTYKLPIAVSRTWQHMFQQPDARSGVVHLLNFSFSDDGRHVSTTLNHEPAPELFFVLKSYVERANERWLRHKGAVVEGERQPDTRSEPER